MRRRIVVSIAGVALVALLLLGIPLALAVEQFYAKEQVLYLDREANEATQHIDPGAISAGEPVEIRDDGGTRLTLYRADGVKLSGGGPRRADEPVQRALDGEPDDARVEGDTVVAIPIYEQGRPVAAIRASEPRQVVVDRTLRAWAVMFVLAVIAFTVVVILARRQARRLTRPIDDLVDAAERLGGGDFSVRTPHSGIAELDQVGQALDTTAERLGTLLARERAFSADASHQLRTPIAGLRVGVESALLAPDADLRGALEATLEPIDRLDATVTELLRLARDTHPPPDPLDVGRLLAEVEAAWPGQPGVNGRALVVTVEDGLGCPAVAEAAIRQIVNVLLENAVVHGAGTVAVRARGIPGAVAIEVSDEGSGVRDGAHVFERRNVGTHGIGLALARSLAEAEGARLVLDQHEASSVFRLILPVDAH